MHLWHQTFFKTTLCRSSLWLMLVFFLAASSVALGGEKEDVRIRAGLDLFPSLLAADMDIENKKNPDGTLQLVLIHSNDKGKALTWANHLKEVKHIRNIPIQVDILDAQSLGRLKQMTPAGIFLTQPMPQSLDQILEYSLNHNVIAFSPFEGDVEHGVQGGIYLSDRLLPYLNIKAMNAAGVRIKSFFLRVSMKYDD